MLSTHLQALVSDARRGELADKTVNTEAQYLQLWQRHAANLADPVDQAFAGGLLADRFAWVFLAGYQPAVRVTFPQATFYQSPASRTDEQGWAAFAVSEDRSEDNPLPGVLSINADTGNNVILNGHKTWVAGCDHVQHIIVSAGRGADAVFYLLHRTDAGVVLSAKPQQRFLAGMSQGIAHLTDVQLTPDRRLDAGAVRWFGLREALYIYTAFAGYVVGRAVNDSLRTTAIQLLDDARQLAGVMPQSSDEIDRLHLFDRNIQALLAQLEATPFARAGNWQHDKKLITMYSRGIQKRQPA